MKVNIGAFRVLKSRLSCLALLSLSLTGCSQHSSPDSEIHSKDILILGEFHGTQEIGKILTEMVSEQRKASRVAIGLEAPHCALIKIFSQEKILTLSRDEGKTCDLSALEMGRISDAIFMSVRDMIDGTNVKIFGLEDHKGRAFRISNGAWDANEWEAHVSDRILQIHSDGYKVTAIVGNIHARKTNYQFDGPSVKPVGAILADQALIIGLSPRSGGHAYACQTQDHCSEMEIPASSGDNPIGLNCSIGGPQYDCLYTVEKYTAAKPLEVSLFQKASE